MKKTQKIAIVFFLIISLAACSKKETAKSGTYLARVDGTTITQAEFDREIQSLPDYARQVFEGPGGKEKFLDEMVKKEVLFQEAGKQGLDKDPEFIKKMEDVRKMALISDLLEKNVMSGVRVTDKEVSDYYDRHKSEFTTAGRTRASHILVKTRAEAERVLQRLEKGEKFGNVAKAVSIDRESAKNGGDIGYFSRGQIVPEFEEAVASMKVGQISGPVKTRFGYHIIKVTDRKPGPVAAFERVKEVIRQKLTGEKQREAFDSYLDNLMKNYKVKINKVALNALKEPGHGAAPEGTTGDKTEE